MKEELDYNVSQLWTMKYQPKTVDEMILPKETKDIINKWKKDGAFPNLLLCSSPGQGKTTLAKALANDFDCTYLYINASDNNDVETIRSTIKNFATTASFNGKMKCVILDEADGFATIQPQKILRALMEEVSDTCRFILTANYGFKILTPIGSRTIELDVTPPEKEIILRCCEIIKQEKVICKNPLKVVQLVKECYPDIRKTILHLWKSVNENNELVIPDDIEITNAFLEGLLDKVKEGNFEEARKYVIDSEKLFNKNYSKLIVDFYHHVINKEGIDYNLKAEWTILLAEYMSKMTIVIDKELNFSACIAEMMKSYAKKIAK